VVKGTLKDLFASSKSAQECGSEVRMRVGGLVLVVYRCIGMSHTTSRG
jgi:hypothetical protein